MSAYATLSMTVNQICLGLHYIESCWKGKIVVPYSVVE